MRNDGRVGQESFVAHSCGLTGERQRMTSLLACRLDLLLALRPLRARRGRDEQSAQCRFWSGDGKRHWAEKCGVKARAISPRHQGHPIARTFEPCRSWRDKALGRVLDVGTIEWHGNAISGLPLRVYKVDRPCAGCLGIPLEAPVSLDPERSVSRLLCGRGCNLTPSICPSVIGASHGQRKSKRRGQGCNDRQPS